MFMLKKVEENDKDYIEEALDEIYKVFSTKIKNNLDSGKTGINKLDLIPITLFYLSKSQKEAAKLEKLLIILTAFLIVLTAVLIYIEIF